MVPQGPREVFRSIPGPALAILSSLLTQPRHSRGGLGNRGPPPGKKSMRRSEVTPAAEGTRGGEGGLVPASEGPSSPERAVYEIRFPCDLGTRRF